MSALSSEFAADLKAVCSSSIHWYGEDIIRAERARRIIATVYAHAGDMVGELMVSKVHEFCKDLPMSYMVGAAGGEKWWQILADAIEATLNTPEIAAMYNRYCRVYDAVSSRLRQMKSIPQELLICSVPYYCSKVKSTTGWYSVAIPSILDHYKSDDPDATDGYELVGCLDGVTQEIANDVIRRNPEIEEL